MIKAELPRPSRPANRATIHGKPLSSGPLPVAGNRAGNTSDTTADTWLTGVDGTTVGTGGVVGEGVGDGSGGGHAPSRKSFSS